MAPWGWVAAGYGAFLTLVAASVPITRRSITIVACLAYATLSLGVATLDALWIHVTAPGALALCGYWLSGFFVRPPQPWLERWLLASDRVVLEAWRIDRALQASPSWLLGLSEFVYSTVYLVVIAGAVMVAPLGRDAVLRYWTVVLPAELLCCAALPFLRCRPPRSIEGPGVIATRAPLMRRVNEVIVRRGSVQVNTFPSAHVAAALAAGLAVTPWRPAAGAAVIVWSALIAVAATVGRYHYAVDCVLGAVVALVLWLIA